MIKYKAVNPLNVKKYNSNLLSNHNIIFISMEYFY
ncbi:hypothetical protein SAMN05421544_11259 [Riemerella columbipharyngis]|uniref:Uncharacterized protein n=1 Tax=Riemerella columbipharyngis TaxID=1071918 RepID=A0A1G7DVG6_9FLAO|nr:hypothetical protein SAMN05421544_11259 [Riemerella columbipharyngis]